MLDKYVANSNLYVWWSILPAELCLMFHIPDTWSVQLPSGDWTSNERFLQISQRLDLPFWSSPSQGVFHFWRQWARKRRSILTIYIWKERNTRYIWIWSSIRMLERFKFALLVSHGKTLSLARWSRQKQKPFSVSNGYVLLGNTSSESTSKGANWLFSQTFPKR